MKDRQDHQFERQLKSILDESTDTIDPQVQYRLQLARAEALENGNNYAPWYKRWYAWASITGMASVCVLAFTLLSTTILIDPAANGLTYNVDTNVFDDETSIELYEEYDFYVWLSQQEANT